jgi:hypothetical protein
VPAGTDDGLRREFPLRSTVCGSAFREHSEANKKAAPKGCLIPATDPTYCEAAGLWCTTGFFAGAAALSSVPFSIVIMNGFGV